MLPRPATLGSPHLTEAVLQTCGAEHTFAAAADVPGGGGLLSGLPVPLSRDKTQPAVSAEREWSQPSWDGTGRCQREDGDVLGKEASQKGCATGAGCDGSGAQIRHECSSRGREKHRCNSQHRALTFVWSTSTETRRLAWCKSRSKCLASSFFKASLHLWTSLILLASQQDTFLFKEQREGGVQEKPSHREISTLHRACAGARPAFQSVPLQCHEFSCERRGVFCSFDNTEIKISKLVSFLFIISSKNIRELWTISFSCLLQSLLTSQNKLHRVPSGTKPTFQINNTEICEGQLNAEKKLWLCLTYHCGLSLPISRRFPMLEQNGQGHFLFIFKNLFQIP